MMDLPKLLLIFTIFFYISTVEAIDITHNVFGTDTQYLPAAFGDFNADKLTDMFVIEKTLNDTYIVRVLISHTIPPLLQSTGPYCAFHNMKIKSIIPSDFDGDGAMDIIVITQQENVYDAHVLWGNLVSFECNDEKVAIASFISQPLLMDYNGDMISDLFGEGVDGIRSFWVFNSEREKPTRILINKFTSDLLPPLKSSADHAFVDIDKDLAADLWISAEGRFEQWLSSNRFSTFEVIQYPQQKNGKNFSVLGQSTFFDIDFDGDIEVLLPVCSDLDCTESFLYIYDFSNSSQEWYALKVNLKDSDEVTWSFPSNKRSYLYTNTITPRVGDINFDGYPDLIMTVFHGVISKVILLTNSECNDDCGYSRTFVPQWDTFKNWPNSVLGTFFDFEEDGTLDVLLVNASSDHQIYTVGAYKDSVEYDATFLKVLVLTGRCYENCPHGKIPYGTNQPGPSLLYSMTSASGDEQKSCATQLTQSSNFALQLPFTVFGLGRNWNFVDKLKVGIPLMHEIKKNFSDYDFYAEYSQPIVQKSVFTQIIPNSQLKVMPYPMNDANLWITKLFITPSTAMLMTAGSLVATCLFVGAIILGLHYKEKKIDKKERRQESQRFHFDAM